VIILGADLATQSGFCWGRPNATPTVEVVRAPVTGCDYGVFGLFYYRTFKRLVLRLLVEAADSERILVNYEAPILPKERWDAAKGKMTGGTALATTRKLHALGVLLETVCAELAESADREIVVRECRVASIKKELGGAGGAVKADLVFAARKAGITLPAGPEEMDGADAFGAWLLAVRHEAPEHTPYWDQRVWGGFHR